MAVKFAPSENHWVVSGFTERVTKKQFQQLLLEGNVFRNGVICEWHGKHLGVGVYELSLKERP